MAVFQIGPQAIKPTKIGEVSRGLQAFRAGQQQIQQQKQQQQLNQAKLQQLRAQTRQIGVQPPEGGSSVLARMKAGAIEEFLNPNTSPERKKSLLSILSSGGATTNVFTGDTRIDASEQGKILTILQQQADELNRGGKFPNATAVVSTDAKGNSILKLEQKAAPSATERKDISEAAASLDSLDNLGTLFDSAFVGPFIGRAGQVKEIFGKNPDQQSAFLAATAIFKNAIIKQITGAQMGENEAKRIMKQVPSPEDSPKTWKNKREQSIKNIEFLKKRRAEVQRSAGLRPTSAGDTKQFPEQPGAFKIGEIRKNSTGKEYKYIGKGKWQAVK